MLNVLKAENDRDIYLVFEYMETDLHAVIRANILEEIHKQYIMYQIFRSLKYMHSAQLLHRDIKVGFMFLVKSVFFLSFTVLSLTGSISVLFENLHSIQRRPDGCCNSLQYMFYFPSVLMVNHVLFFRGRFLHYLSLPFQFTLLSFPPQPPFPSITPLQPSNVLLNSECQVKMADFGLARSVAQLHTEEGNPVLTDYVATRWYRAPEILLSSTRYTFGVDMWACGCILGELISGKPIFPGTSTMNQLDRILEVTGRPSAEDIDAIQSPFAATMLESMRAPDTPRLEAMFPTASPEALDLMSKLMHFNPDKRISAEEALRHPYCAQFHNPSDEPLATSLITIPIDDNTKYSIAEYRDRLYMEIVKRKKEIRKRMKEKEAARAAAKAQAREARSGSYSRTAAAEVYAK